MKVLLINNAYPTENNKKAGGYIKTIAECIQQSGADVTFLVIKRTKPTFFTKLIQYITFYKDILKIRDTKKNL